MLDRASDSWLGPSRELLHGQPAAVREDLVPSKLDLHTKHKSDYEERGLRLASQHHETYLSDPRRVRPEKLKTILRHPVK